jgi:hypothetical protein
VNPWTLRYTEYASPWASRYTVVTGMGSFTVDTGYTQASTWGGYGRWYPTTTRYETTCLGTCPPATAYWRGAGC